MDMHGSLEDFCHHHHSEGDRWGHKLSLAKVQSEHKVSPSIVGLDSTLFGLSGLFQHHWAGLLWSAENRIHLI